MIAHHIREIFLDDMISQDSDLVLFAAMEKMLEMAEADMASRQAGEDRAGFGPLAQHRLAGGHDRQGAAGGNAQRGQRLAGQIFADGGAHHRPAVAKA